MLRRLLNDLQQCIERGDGQHMHLVNDVHPALHLRRSVDGIIPQVPHIVHTVVGGCVNLQHIHTASRINAPAGRADIAGIAILGIQAIHRLGQNFGTAGLSCTPGAGEQVGMAQPSRLKLGLERLGNARLPHHLVKGLGPVFPVQSLIHYKFLLVFRKRIKNGRLITRSHTHI